MYEENLLSILGSANKDQKIKMLQKVKILDIEFDNITLTEAVDLIFDAVDLREQKLISFINAHSKHLV